ncbi:MAG TPA: peptidoglycan DD-metalloendopeptidase family protein, partial [Anaerolineaceae bacterium]|nr:peptidoglycan DD-metalloendopeptidase family protein [Anaerolineaceae bacterium]
GLATLSDSGWQVILPSDPEWDETFDLIPESMLPVEKQSKGNMVFDTVQVTTPLTGYYLPFVAGTQQWLEGSISHFQSIPELGYPSCYESECRYAYDFTNIDHFPLLASKDGTVHASRDSCHDGDPTCTNYIVLKDTNNLTYQIYLHLAYGTIPDKLTNGTFVKRGQYIGDTDDTGYSTSNHVHFMVVDTLTSIYWGRSIDVRFADVPINNGIPRTCYEVTTFKIYDGATECIGNKSDPRNPANDWFVSGNVGAYPPTGNLTRPVAGATVATGDNPTIDVTATASDDVRVKAVRLVAKLNNQWVEIGPKVTQPVSADTYDWDVDLCAAAPVNGALEIALRVWDHEGNVASALSPRTINVDHACPPPDSELKPANSFDSTAVQLTWNASAAGAGISSFELQWRTEPGVWDAQNINIIPGNQRSAWFVGSLGGSYAFRLRAVDNNNQYEPWPAGNVSETSVILPSTCELDSFEPDDDPSQSKELNIDEKQQRNLCGVGNSDWFNVYLEEEVNYRILSKSISGGAATKITLLPDDEETILRQGTAMGAGMDSDLIFSVENTGAYFIKIEPLVANLVGTAAIYELSISEVELIYLPLVNR